MGCSEFVLNHRFETIPCDWLYIN